MIGVMIVPRGGRTSQTVWRGGWALTMQLNQGTGGREAYLLCGAPGWRYEHSQNLA